MAPGARRHQSEVWRRTEAAVASTSPRSTGRPRRVMVARQTLGDAGPAIGSPRVIARPRPIRSGSTVYNTASQATGNLRRPSRQPAHGRPHQRGERGGGEPGRGRDDVGGNLGLPRRYLAGSSDRCRSRHQASCQRPRNGRSRLRLCRTACLAAGAGWTRPLRLTSQRSAEAARSLDRYIRVRARHGQAYRPQLGGTTERR